MSMEIGNVGDLSSMGISDSIKNTSLIGLPGQKEMPQIQGGDIPAELQEGQIPGQKPGQLPGQMPGSQKPGEATSLQGIPEEAKVKDGFNQTGDLMQQAQELMKKQGLDPNHKQNFLDQLSSNTANPAMNNPTNAVMNQAMANNAMRNVGNTLMALGDKGGSGAGSATPAGNDPVKPGSGTGQTQVTAKKDGSGDELKQALDTQKGLQGDHTNAMNQNVQDGQTARKGQQGALEDKKNIESKDIPKDQQQIQEGKSNVAKGNSDVIQGKQDVTSGQAQKAKGVGEQVAGKAVQAAGDALKMAGKALQQVGKALQQTGKGLQTTGQTTQTSGQTMQTSGQSMMACPYTAAAGAALMSAGTALFGAGKGIETAGQGVEKAGQGQEKTGEQQEKTGEQQKQKGVQQENTGKKTEETGDQTVKKGEKTVEDGNQIKAKGQEMENQGTESLNNNKNLAQQKAGEAKDLGNTAKLNEGAAQQRAQDLNKIGDNMNKLNDAMQKMNKGAGKGAGNQDDMNKLAAMNNMANSLGQLAMLNALQKNRMSPDDMKKMMGQNPQQLQQMMANQQGKQGQQVNPASGVNTQNMAQSALRGDFNGVLQQTAGAQQSIPASAPQAPTGADTVKPTGAAQVSAAPAVTSSAPQAAPAAPVAPQTPAAPVTPQVSGQQESVKPAGGDGLLAGAPIGKQDPSQGAAKQQPKGADDGMGGKPGMGDEEMAGGIPQSEGEDAGEFGGVQSQSGGASVEENDEGITVNLNQIGNETGSGGARGGSPTGSIGGIGSGVTGEDLDMAGGIGDKQGGLGNNLMKSKGVPGVANQGIMPGSIFNIKE